MWHWRRVCRRPRGKFLRLQHRDQPEDALAATLGKRIANRDFLQDRRHGVEVELVERARAEESRKLAALLAASELM